MEAAKGVRSHCDELLAQREACATLLQAAYRGYLLRARLGRQREEREYAASEARRLGELERMTAELALQVWQL